MRNEAETWGIEAQEDIVWILRTVDYKICYEVWSFFRWLIPTWRSFRVIDLERYEDKEICNLDTWFVVSILSPAWLTCRFTLNLSAFWWLLLEMSVWLFMFDLYLILLFDRLIFLKVVRACDLFIKKIFPKHNFPKIIFTSLLLPLH